MTAYRNRSGHIGAQEVVSLVVLCLAMLICISFYLPVEVSGAMGVFWRYLGFGLCGPLYHCIPLLLLLTAWLGFRHRRYGLPKQLIVHGLIFYLLIGALLQFFTMDQKLFVQQVEEMTRFYQHTETSLWFATSNVRATTGVSLLWQASVDPVNFPLLQNVRPVGVLAGTFSLAFYELFGPLVGKIILLILLAVELRIIFGFSLLEWLLAAKDVVISSNMNIKQAVHETMQELAAQKAEEEANLASLYPELTSEEQPPQTFINHFWPVLTGAKDSDSKESSELALLPESDEQTTNSPIVINSEPDPVIKSQITEVTEEKIPVDIEEETQVFENDNTSFADKSSNLNDADQTEKTLQNVSPVTITSNTDCDNLQIEPELIDHNAWRKQANKRIWSSVEQENLFNPAMQKRDSVKARLNDSSDTLTNPAFDSQLDKKLLAKPILQSLDLDLHSAQQAQTVNKKQVDNSSNLHNKLRAEQAEQAALNREYDLLNKSSLQPQFALEEKEVSLDPFALNPQAQELSLNEQTAKQNIDDFSIWTELKNNKVTTDDNHVVDSSTVLEQNNLAKITKETASASNPKNVVELLADLDLTHDKAEVENDEPTEIKYTLKESKDSLLKASAISKLVKTDNTYKPAYVFPQIDLLTEVKNNNNSNNTELIRSQADRLVNTLKSFGVEAEVINITTGPTITRFELTPGVGVKVAKIVNLTDDIALSLAATGVRIEAPIPGKSAIGIEIPNKEKRVVDLRSLLASNKWQSDKHPLKVALGRDIPGQSIIADLADMTHTLIAGATGSGKSICINAILISLLYHCRPEDLKLIMVDPKVVELSIYNGIPHLLAPVVTDPKKAAKALNWACLEMEKRYQKLAKAQVRDIKSYNEYVGKHEGLHKSRLDSNGQLVYEIMEHMPYLVIVIDELADLMMTAPQEVEEAINRIAAKGRACGIHLILATQRPSVDVITGVIKANVPSRIAFAVSSQVDSRTILDGAGAEKLLGKGDMLYNPRGAVKAIRGQGAYISDQDVEAVVNFIKFENAAYIENNPVDIFLDKNSASDTNSSSNEEQDELFDAAMETVLDAGYASVSILQRRLNIGYPRAGRLIDSLEKAGLIGPANGSKPREILISRSDWENR